MAYYSIVNGSVLTSENRDILDRFYEVVLELPEDYEEGKYTAINGELVLNDNWVNLKRKNEIMARLYELDMKSIRAIRANDTDYIQAYEAEAESLRKELNVLLV